MKKLSLKFENCYGIRLLEEELDFETCKMHSIYAANGFMKTSFSKTMSDYSKGTPSKDLVYSERNTTRNIVDENGVDIDPSSIFVIEPYNQEFSSDKISTLLVNAIIKKQYDDALIRIEEKRGASPFQGTNLSPISWGYRLRWPFSGSKKFIKVH